MSWEDIYKIILAIVKECRDTDHGDFLTVKNEILEECQNNSERMYTLIKELFDLIENYI